MTDTSLVIERSFRASPATVWRCLTDPELMKQWFAPKPVTLPMVALDLFAGGRFHIVMDVPDHGRIDEGPGCVLVVEPEQRIAWTNVMFPGFRPRTLGAGPMDFPLTAIMTLGSDGANGCRYTATALHASLDDMKKHEQMGFHEGWGTVADQLGALAATL